MRTEYGRDRDPFEIHVISMDAYTPDGIKRLEDKGVTDVIVGFRDPYTMGDQPLDQKVAALEGFAKVGLGFARAFLFEQEDPDAGEGRQDAVSNAGRFGEVHEDSLGDLKLLVHQCAGLLQLANARQGRCKNRNAAR